MSNGTRGLLAARAGRRDFTHGNGTRTDRAESVRAWASQGSGDEEVADREDYNVENGFGREVHGGGLIWRLN